MRKDVATSSTLKVLSLARQVANHAAALGADQAGRKQRPCTSHLGAIMADAILQSGVNYRTVVYPRISAILDQYPDACSLGGVKAIIEAGRLAEFLRWRHPTKIERFRELAYYFDRRGIETLDHLLESFGRVEFRNGLLNLHGIGPKTVDYLGCLAGIDVIAVDRHIMSFARDSGIETKDYDSLRAIFSYAADLLRLSRRDFDAWVWTTISLRRSDSGRFSISV